MKVDQILTLVAMFLGAASPLLNDTTPGSPRSIVVALTMVLFAVVMLIHTLQPTSSSIRQSTVLGPDRLDVVITVVFTIVELVTLTLWGIMIGAPLAYSAGAGVVLSVGLFLEHLISRFKG